MSAQDPAPTPPPTPAASQPAKGATTQQQPTASAMLEIYQKNFAALTAARYSLSQGAATLFQAQQDALSSAVHQAATASSETVAARAPQACPEAVTRFKQALDASVANLQQMSALTEAARRNAFATIQARMTTLLQEGAAPGSATLGSLNTQAAAVSPATSAQPAAPALVGQPAAAPGSATPGVRSSQPAAAAPATSAQPAPPAKAVAAQPAAAPAPKPRTGRR